MKQLFSVVLTAFVLCMTFAPLAHADDYTDTDDDYTDNGDYVDIGDYDTVAPIDLDEYSAIAAIVDVDAFGATGGVAAAYDHDGNPIGNAVVQGVTALDNRVTLSGNSCEGCPANGIIVDASVEAAQVAAAAAENPGFAGMQTSAATSTHLDLDAILRRSSNIEDKDDEMSDDDSH